ncbi:peptidase S8/S53 domain-containing protein [Thelonectria olida]|uniref:Peptidase S8/S53 domain-containing protein n=1 Tax=Thelonectria olida TaxID=1576542 RepID=A0A9P8VZF1_9HYPO|nr:peptidase S8/S53 domain-containing protein [Thelonectria olida]
MKKECENRFSHHSIILRVVSQCLDLNAFHCGQEPKFDDYSDPDLLRHIYDHILQPLEDDILDESSETGNTSILGNVLKEAPRDPILSLDSHDPTALKNPWARQPAHHRASKRTWDEMEQDSSDPEDEGGYELEDMEDFTREIPASQKFWTSTWQRLMNTLHEKLAQNDMRAHPFKKKEQDDFVKIAIIDSGCDKAILSKRPSGVELSGWKDYVTNGTQMVDNCGHGTSVTHILLNTIRFGKVFIMRVFDQNEADRHTSKRVAEAIMHAVDTWDVDVISMSFSLNGSPQSVEDAIEHAVNRRVLMFAAASNRKHANESPIGFPACLGKHVICVNAYGNDQKRCGFSPLERAGRVNFALPGEAIPAMGRGGVEVTKQGTSCATPIAAGIAAMVLDYSVRFRDTATKDCWVRKRNRLKDITVMKRVMYEHMTDDKTIGKYNRIEPWRLFGGGDDDRLNDVDRAAHIAHALISTTGTHSCLVKYAELALHPPVHQQRDALSERSS